MKKIIIILFVFMVKSVCSQNVEFTKENFPADKKGLKTALSDLKRGHKVFRAEIYNEALEYYLKADKFNPKNALLNYNISQCYLNLRNTELGLKYAEDAYRLASDVAYNITFFKGWACQIRYEFDSAIMYFNHFLESKQINMEEQKATRKHIQECERGKELILHELRCFIDNVGSSINSSEDDYGPVISADESVIFFTSRRKGNNIDIALDGRAFEKIYTSEKKENGEWTQAKLVSELSSKAFDAVQGLSNDGQKIIIYRAENSGDLLESQIKSGKFTSPRSLKMINTREYHETSASYSYDGKTLYFCSDKKGGFGNHDIYKVTRDANGKWGKPENLGDVINTPEEEISVFAHPDGKTLYFSSKGHDGMGGFDIFYSTFEDGKWTKPVNLGYPVNTTSDDLFFVMAANGKHGYYSSARPGGFGGHDIYMITFLGPEKSFAFSMEDQLLSGKVKTISENVAIKTMAVEEPKLTLLKGMVISKETKQPLLANIELYDIEKNELLASFESNEVTGKYLLSLPSGKNYGINVNAKNFLFYSENFNIPDTVKYQEVEQLIELESLEKDKKVVLKNIFFDLNKSSLRKESTMELDKLYQLLTDNPNIHIEVSGHTDNIGSAAYNKKLSLERAQSVSNYLIGKGIDKQRITNAGYGFDQPIAPNTTEEGRQMNRRTEFKITQ